MPALRSTLRAARALVLAALFAPAPAPAQVSTTDTRLLAQPAVSATRIAFAYAGDLWTARLDGSDVRRITNRVGYDGGAWFSPDGKYIVWRAGYPKTAADTARAARMIAPA